MLLEGKSGVVFGVANKRSIAYACAKAASAHGARLILTYQGERLARGVAELADGLPGEAIALPCDVNTDEAMDESVAAISEHFGGKVDFAVHSIAFANREELVGRFSDTSREGWTTAQLISAWSLAGLAKRITPLMTDGGSIVTMSYMGAEKVVPHYNVMGPAKAALEASVRYLAHDFGPSNVRVNAVSAGPVRTLAAQGISGFSTMLDICAARAPLRRNIETSEVADVTVFLLSDMSRAITGATIHVDNGFSITAL